MNSLEPISTVTALANAIACKLTNDEINWIATLLDQLSDTLSTIAKNRQKKIIADEVSFDSSSVFFI